MKTQTRLTLPGNLLGAFCLTMAVAQPGLADGQDPPSRIARLNYSAGAVSFQPAGSDDWAPVTINRPLTIGDNLWSDQGSRAEMHIDGAAIRLDGNTSLGIINLDEGTVQLKLGQGLVQIRVSHLSEDDVFEVDTPNSAITLLREGEYLIGVDSYSQTSSVMVRHGHVEVTGGGQAFNVHHGQFATLSGDDQIAYNLQDAPGLNDFERFGEDRDRQEVQWAAASARYIPPGVVGAEDLGNYGAWRNVPGYGMVWSPTGMPPGWAPYHAGHWAFIRPWGWTWVDDAPWGFAPFHYGRWAFAGEGWVWIPGQPAVAGQAVVRPVYAPALVAFIGGSHFSLSLSIGGGGGAAALAWVPLGPGEVFTPAYHVSPRYFNNVNVSNTVVEKTVNITNVYNTTYVTNNTTVVNRTYVNAQAPGAVMAMHQEAMAAGRPVASSGRSLQANEVEQVRSMPAMAAPPVTPTRQSYAPSMNPGRPAPKPPAQVMARPVVTKQAPPAAVSAKMPTRAVSAPAAAPKQPAPRAQPVQPAPAPPAQPAKAIPAPATQPAMPAPVRQAQPARATPAPPVEPVKPAPVPPTEPASATPAPPVQPVKPAPASQAQPAKAIPPPATQATKPVPVPQAQPAKATPAPPAAPAKAAPPKKQTPKQEKKPAKREEEKEEKKPN
jgi:hypothetical protein